MNKTWVLRRPLVQAVGDTYPRFIGPFMVGTFVASCSAWPDADPPLIRHIQHHLDVPILLIGSEFDPAAPLSWTKRMAQALDAVNDDLWGVESLDIR